MSEKVRIDKWLWSVRIFKSRTLATDNVKAGRIKVGNTIVKPSSTVQEGDLVEVRKGGFNLCFKVLKTIEKRVSAPIAQTCYENQTPVEEMNKFNAWFVGKAAPEFRERGSGRPTKKERRQIDDFKTDWFDEFDEEYS